MQIRFVNFVTFFLALLSMILVSYLPALAVPVSFGAPSVPQAMINLEAMQDRLYAPYPLHKIANDEDRKLAVNYCKGKYKTQYYDVKLESDGRFRCLYKRTSTEVYTLAEKACRDKHGEKFKNVEIKGTRYRCIFKKSDNRLRREAESLCRKRLGKRFASVSFPLANEGTFSRFVCESR